MQKSLKIMLLLQMLFLFFASSSFAVNEQGKPIVKEIYPSTEEVLVLDVTCDISKDLYGATIQKIDKKFLEDEIKKDSKLSVLRDKQGGIFLNGKYENKTNFQHDCVLSKSFNAKTIFDLNTPILTREVHTQISAESQKIDQTVLSSPIHITITDGHNNIFESLYSHRHFEHLKFDGKTLLFSETKKSQISKSIKQLRNAPLIMNHSTIHIDI